MKAHRAAHRAITALVVLSLAVACSSDESDDGDEESGGGTGGTASPTMDAGPGAAGGNGGSGGTEPEPKDPIDPAWLACATDADCVVIPQQRTCVACFAISVNVAHEQDVIDHYGELSDCVERRSAPCPPAPEAAVCTAGRCDFTVDCEVMEKSGLCGEHAKCSVLAAPECGDGEVVRVGCFPKAASADVVSQPTCAEDPETGQQLRFLSTEIPPGWLVCDIDACEAGILQPAPTDGGGASSGDDGGAAMDAGAADGG